MDAIKKGTNEYKQVLSWSKDRVSLLNFHAITIGADQALKIIFTYLDEDEVAVRFTAKNRGRAKGWSNGYIRLPADGSEFLTVGLVLHEVSHIINHNDNGIRGHGREFVSILDRLVESEKTK